METMKTAFRSLDKKDQINFSKRFGRKMTGLQFNKIYAVFDKQASRNIDTNFYTDIVKHDYWNADRYVKWFIGYVVKYFDYSYGDNLMLTWRTYTDVEKAKLQPYIDLAFEIVDLCNTVKKRMARDTMKAEIEAESEGLLTLSELRKKFWMLNIQQINRTKLTVQCFGGHDWNNKSSKFLYKKFITMPTTKGGYYSPKEFVKVVGTDLIQYHIDNFKKQMEEMEKVRTFMEAEK